jgi:PhnB protein
MSTTTTPSPAPTKANHPTAPSVHLIVDGAARAIEFYTKTFGATEVRRVAMNGSDRLMHAELSLGGGTIYLCDDFPEMNNGKSRTPKALGGTPLVIHRYVPDVDAAFNRAVAAGAKVLMPVADQFWGDRYAQLEDPFGHHWSLATPLNK